MNLTALAFSGQLTPAEKLDAIGRAHPEFSFVLNAIAVQIDDFEGQYEHWETLSLNDYETIRLLKLDLQKIQPENVRLIHDLDEKKVMNSVLDDEISALNQRIETLESEQNELLEENKNALNKLRTMSMLGWGRFPRLSSYRLKMLPSLKSSDEARRLNLRTCPRRS